MRELSDPAQSTRPDDVADTRTRIVEAATALVIEHGYQRTTMRAIAERAGVSLGSAYYYYGGKEELIQGIYNQIVDEHCALARERMAGQTAFSDRIASAVNAYLDVSARYRGIADSLLALAIVPSSSLSPFSDESAPTRQKMTAMYGEVVSGSDLKTDSDLLAHLPEALWLMHMGITLGWVHDQTPNQQATRVIAGKALPALDKLLRLARVPLLKPFIKEAVEILEMLDRKHS